MSQPNPSPQGIVAGLSFDNIKTELADALNAATTAAEFAQRFGWFIPEKYKTALDELVKLLTWAQDLLNKMP